MSPPILLTRLGGVQKLQFMFRIYGMLFDVIFIIIFILKIEI